MDDERLKNPPIDGVAASDYFDELLERIRNIRASERRIYLRVRAIFGLAGDYRSDAPETAPFLLTMENKLHLAATGKVAAEAWNGLGAKDVLPAAIRKAIGDQIEKGVRQTNAELRG